MSAVQCFRPSCSGCIFQQDLAQLDSGFQVTLVCGLSHSSLVRITMQWLLCSCWKAVAGHGPQPVLEVPKKGSRATLPGGLASQPCPAAVLACPCSPPAALPEQSNAVPSAAPSSCLIACATAAALSKGVQRRGSCSQCSQPTGLSCQQLCVELAGA